ncbi:MAG: helicase [Planctomycetes bacterium]|nr:helicase [Planctomycetota bacterium]
MLPFAIDNDEHRLADALNDLLGQSRGRPVDVATAYFSISGYRLVREWLPHVGAFRLLIGSDPQTGADVGMVPARAAAVRQLAGDVDAEPFTPETLRLVEELIAFLRSEKVEMRLFDKGFLHAKAYLFHQDVVGPQNRHDRLRPFAAIVGSSNFTGPGLQSNRELNLVHRVFTPGDEAVDVEAARRVEYLRHGEAVHESLLDPAGVDLPDAARRFIKSEVGARAVTELMRWFEKEWTQSTDFKDALIELFDSSKFGTKEYAPYQIYLKALYEYFKDELGEELLDPGRSAVDLAEFQDDAVKKARRILARYDGVLIADSVGLGKTWIGKKLLEDFAYHRRQKAVVVCPASLREMWRRELAAATIAAEVVGMEELGRDGFDTSRLGDADVLLVDESHNFRNGKSNRYIALDEAIQRSGGRGRDGERKKVILLSATPINNDLYDLANQINLFTQSEPDYFRDAGIGDLNSYFRRARRMLNQDDTPAGIVLFNLLEEIMVRNTRPYIRAAYPNATIGGRKVVFPDRRLHTVEYSLGETYGGLYGEVVAEIERLSLASYQLESYRKEAAIRDRQAHEWEAGREIALVGLFKTRFLKRLESSIHAFRESLRRALVFEETYLDYLLSGSVVSNRDFHRLLRFLAQDEEDEPAAGSVYEDLDTRDDARQYIEGLEKVDLNDFNMRRLVRDVEEDVRLLRTLYERTESLARSDGKLQRLKDLLTGELKGRKVLIFSSYKDTSRYVHRELTEERSNDWRSAAGGPTIRRIDSGNHPDERGRILRLFAPVANGSDVPADEQIDILISTDVLSEGQNLQDCGVIVNYDLTWNPVRLVQRNGRIDRIGSPHAQIGIYNMFPEDELESLLHLVERLTSRISTIDAFGLLDASILGESVHPRTFNTLRRIREQDGAVLDEEEARAELAGPEVLLKHLKEMLGREAGESVADLPNGIHSGLRRQDCYGIFFYFQAPRPGGEGRRHFWRYIDARTGEIEDNRYEIARRIACRPDEPRYIGDQDVFALQEKVIEHVLAAQREVEARAAAPPTVDPIQQVVNEELKDALRRQKVDRDLAKEAIRFLGQPMGRSLHRKLKSAWDEWSASRDDGVLVARMALLAGEFSKDRPSTESTASLRREDLTLVCFEYVTG